MRALKRHYPRASGEKRTSRDISHGETASTHSPDDDNSSSSYTCNSCLTSSSVGTLPFVTTFPSITMAGVVIMS